MHPVSLELQLPSEMQIAEHLSAAVRCQTVSFDNDSPAGPFLELHARLEEMYPLVHAKLHKEVINDLSLLYTWRGSQPDLPGAAFLAHQDVVPVVDGEAGWTYPAYSGTIADGLIWGRGVIDMKSHLIALLEAVETLLKAGFQPQRTIYLAFGHDEEVGGRQGARIIAAALEERGVRLEALLDEGGAVSGGMAPGISGLIASVAMAEKSFANVVLEAKARAGHASVPGRLTAIGRLSRAVMRLDRHPMPARLEFVRPTIQALLPYLPWPLRLLFGNLWLTGGLVKMGLAQSPFSNAMIRNTMAPTLIQGGYKLNILPETASVSFNCRLLPGTGVEELLDHISKVVDDRQVSVRLIDTSAPSKKPGSIDTPSFRSLSEVINRHFANIPVCPMVMFGSTDARYYERICQNVLRFQPNTFENPDDDRTHGIDERLPISQLPVMVSFNAQLMVAWAGEAVK